MLLSMLKIGLLVYLGLGAFLYFAQRSFMYMPTPPRDGDGAHAEYLDNDGVRLKLWRVGEVADRAVIYFGGNAEDVYFNADDFRRVLPGHTVYLVNYRGYGGSGGSPSEDGLFADALHVFDHVDPRHEAVSVVGRSLGSAVAAYLAANRPLHRMVLVTPFDSAVSVARSLYPVYPVSLMLKDRYESVRHVADVEVPTLLLVAEHDRVIPPRHAEALAAAFPDGVARQRVITDAGHNGLSRFDEYWQAIAVFLREG
jgi:pimeloyl-ACP methyl ester carboxylesterase